MRGLTMSFKLAAIAFAGAATLSQSWAAASAVGGDKADVACLVALAKMQEKVTQDNSADPKKQLALQNIAQVTSYYVGKLIGRHPNEAPSALAKRMDLKSPEMYKLLDLTRCATEFKASMSGQKP